MVLDDKKNILLVKGARRGWEFPGGFVNRGESIRSAAIREVKEEAGVDIQILRTLGVEHDMNQSISVFVFEGKLIGGIPRSSKENEEAAFFPYEEAMEKIHLKQFKDRLYRCVHQKNIPYIIEH
jgi:8-oxo-dGTP diphosphatase